MVVTTANERRTYTWLGVGHCSFSYNFHYLITCRRPCDGNKNNVCLIYPWCNRNNDNQPDAHTAPEPNKTHPEKIQTSRFCTLGSGQTPINKFKGGRKIIFILSLSGIFIRLAVSLSFEAGCPRVTPMIISLTVPDSALMNERTSEWRRAFSYSSIPINW